MDIKKVLRTYSTYVVLHGATAKTVNMITDFVHEIMPRNK